MCVCVCVCVCEGGGRVLANALHALEKGTAVPLAMAIESSPRQQACPKIGQPS